MEEIGHSSLNNNGRSSHNVGRLGNLIRVSALRHLYVCIHTYVYLPLGTSGA